MKKAKNFLPIMLLGSALILLFVLIMQPVSVFRFRDYIDILFPQGIIAREERNLLLIIQAIMLLVILPVYILTFVFSWRYRAVNNPKGKYDPNLVENHYAEYIWWGIPLVLTAVVAVLTYVKTYELDPYKPLESTVPAKRIQVVSLQWKWLFIYPEEKLAIVNFLQFPKETPIHFEITSDAPMNSFWIPKLGGQIYAMPGMKTNLYLMAQETGDFRGSSANLSGEGFSGMHFISRAVSDDHYHLWVAEAKKSAKVLDLEEYNKLVAPSSDNPTEIYQLKDDELFDKIIMKYMHPQEK